MSLGALESSERFQVTKLIGKGHHGGIYEVQDGESQERWALRRFFDASGNYYLNESQETALIALLERAAKLEVPGLMKLVDWGRDDDGIFIVSELLEGPNLNEAVTERSFSADELARMAKAQLKALDRLHEVGVRLGAMDGSFFKLVEAGDQSCELVLIDYGWERAISTTADEWSPRLVRRGACAAPEFLQSGQATVAGDLYGFGQILFMMGAAGHPLAGLDGEAALPRHQAANMGVLSDYRRQVPDYLVEWLAGLTVLEPAQRPATAQVARAFLSAAMASSQADGAAPRKRRAKAPVKLNQGLAAEAQEMGDLSQTGPIAPMGATGPQVLTSRVALNTGPQLLIGKTPVHTGPVLVSQASPQAAAAPVGQGEAAAVETPLEANQVSQSKRGGPSSFPKKGAMVALVVVLLVAVGLGVKFKLDQRAGAAEAVESLEESDLSEAEKATRRAEAFARQLQNQ